jgi:hypothetical protein
MLSEGGKGASWVSTKVRLSQDRLPIEQFPSRISQGRGKAQHWVRAKGSKLGESCPKVKLSQDMMPIEPFGYMKS